MIAVAATERTVAPSNDAAGVANDDGSPPAAADTAELHPPKPKRRYSASLKPGELDEFVAVMDVPDTVAEDGFFKQKTAYEIE
eukprot:COSAG01_NODE_48250_length_383_cov_0.366197_1_plen_83_part_00